MTRFSPFVLNHNMVERRHDGGRPTLSQILSAINGNAGNAVIMPSILRHLDMGPTVQGIDNMFRAGALASVSPDEVNERHSHLFITMQDQIKLQDAELPWAEMCEWLSKITIPVVPFGIGANTVDTEPQALVSTLPKAMIRFFQIMADKSKYISVRGAFTADVMVKLGVYNVKETGCPSYFSNGPDYVVKKRPLSGSEVKRGKIAATGLFACAEPERVHYFLQDELMFLRAIFGEAPPPTLLDFADISYPHYASQSLAALRDSRMYFYYNTDEWSQALTDKYIFSCGSRVHGSIRALLAGVPALCTAGDMRSKEMCGLLRIPHAPGVDMSNLTAEHIYDKIDVAPTNRVYAERYGYFIDFLTASGLTPNYKKAAPVDVKGGARKLLPDMGTLQKLAAAYLAMHT